MNRFLLLLAAGAIAVGLVSCGGTPTLTPTPAATSMTTTDVGAIQTEAARSAFATVTAEAQGIATVSAVETRAAQSVLATITAETEIKTAETAAAALTLIAQATDTPRPTATVVPTETPTHTPTPTDTPVPTETHTPTPAPTSAPTATDTDTPAPAVTATPVPTDTATPVRKPKCAALTPLWAAQFARTAGIIPLGAYQCDKPAYSAVYVLFGSAGDAAEAEQAIRAGLEGEVKAIAGKPLFWAPAEQLGLLRHEDGLYLIAVPSLDMIDEGTVYAALEMRTEYAIETATPAPTETDIPLPISTPVPAATETPVAAPTCTSTVEQVAATTAAFTSALDARATEEARDKEIAWARDATLAAKAPRALPQSAIDTVEAEYATRLAEAVQGPSTPVPEATADTHPSEPGASTVLLPSPTASALYYDAEKAEYATKPAEPGDLPTPIPLPAAPILHYRVPDDELARHYVVELASGESYELPTQGDSILVRALPEDGMILVVDGVKPTFGASLMEYRTGRRTPLVTGEGSSYSSAVWSCLSGDRERIGLVTREEKDDGNALYHGSLWNASGRMLDDLGSVPSGWSMSFSPDSQKLAYWRDAGAQRQLYVTDRNGGDPVYLAGAVPGEDSLYSAFVADGQRIIYTIPDGEGAAAYSVSPEGADRVELCSIREGRLSVWRTPSSEWVVCVAGKTYGEESLVAVVNVLDGEILPLGTNVRARGYYPRIAFSQDGETVAITAREAKEGPAWHMLVRPRSGERSNLESGALDMDNSPVGLAPDGTWWVSSAYDESRETRGLYAMYPVETQEASPVELISPLEGFGWYVHGYVLPDGEHVLAGCGSNDGSRSLFIMRRDGSGRIPLGAGSMPTRGMTTAADVIYFAAERDGKQGVYRVNPDGSDIRLMYPDGEQAEVDPCYRYPAPRPVKPPAKPTLTPTPAALPD